MITPGRRLAALALAALLGTLPSRASAQIADGQTANFEDGTTQGWTINLLGGAPPPFGQPIAPANVRPANFGNGGPLGAGDNYLRLNAIGGNGPGSRLMVINPAFWGGDYLAAGVTSIRMDVLNLNSQPLSLRFLVEDAGAGPPMNVAASILPVMLGVSTQWQSIEFPIFGPNGLGALLGNVNSALTGATIVRIYHNPSFAPDGSPIVAELGIDNVNAVITPEPSTFLLLGAGGLALLYVRRRRSTR